MKYFILIASICSLATRLYVKIILAIIVYLLTNLSFAGEWRPRIREHFESHSISRNGSDFSYKGTHNTINFWYEEPFKYSVGFAFGPLLGSARNKEPSADPFLGDKIHLLHLGIEGKYFPLPDRGLFGRGGLYASELDKNGSDIRGGSIYAGIGWEFLFKGVGIAIEAGYRYSRFEQNVSVQSFTPAIGFHFYNLL